MKLRLEIEVEYSLEDGTPLPEAMLEEVKACLLSIGDNAAANGRLSGNTDAEVDTWEARVLRVDC